MNKEQVLGRIQNGESTAWEQALDELGPYLRVMAQRHLDPRLRPRVDPADVVQEACYEAHRDIASFRGASWPEFVGWLVAVVKHRALASSREHLEAQKRSVARERDASARTPGAPAPQFDSQISSPSQRAMRGEDAIRLAQALVSLAPDQREAVRLRHLEGCSLLELARHLERSEVAAASLLKRGLQSLRELLTDPDATPATGSGRPPA